MFRIQKLEHFFESHKHVGILLLRIFIGFRLLYGVIDNMLSWVRMIEFADFLEVNNFPFPIISAITSVYIQFICALLILVGFKVRLASLLLVINFLIALFFIHILSKDTIEGMTPALAMLFGNLTLLFTGADKISIEGYLKLNQPKSE